MTTTAPARHVLLSLLFLVFINAVSTGCTEKETPKKVSLYRRSPETSSSADKNRNDVLQFGFDLILGPKEDVKIFTPFLAYLEEATGTDFHIRFNEKLEDMVDNLGKGITHFAVMDPLGYVIGREKYGRGIRYLVSGVNNEGDARNHAVVFTEPNSDIYKLEDLRGRSFSFGAKMSMQGHIIPRKMLEDAGITLDSLGSYQYAGSSINSVSAVLNGQYDAGALQDTLARKLALEGKIKIIRISKPYPSEIVACNTNVSGPVIEAVESALLAFEPAGRHKDMLMEWHKTNMSLGFIRTTGSEFYSIAILASKYGLLSP